MKYILINTELQQTGPFNQVTAIPDGYDCDGVLYYTSVTGSITEVREVADDYMTPEQIETFNAEQSRLREAAYKISSDPVNFQYQADVKTKQDWLDARDAVQALYPYKEAD